MTSKAELIILSYTKFGENSIVLHTVSEEYGRRGFLVPSDTFHNHPWILPSMFKSNIEVFVMDQNATIRKLPAGIQDFEKLRQGNNLYIDKTAYIYELVKAGAPCFLSRPRRFGKSLLLSSMKAYFCGKRELFDGLAITDLAKDDPDAFVKHPVFYIDFNKGNYSESEDAPSVILETEPDAECDADDSAKHGKRGRLVIEKVLDMHLREWEEIYGSNPANDTLALRFDYLIKEASRQTGRRAVVLVDEYDKPLLESDPALDKHNRDVFKGFFSILKSDDAYLKFVFITGVTKFSKVSIFSDLNQLEDISLDKKYAGICGISEEEMKASFVPEIERLAGNNDLTVMECLNELKRMYDGYHFCHDTVGMYNPFSLINAFKSEEFDSKWFESGTPTFLIRKLGETGFDPKRITDGSLYESRDKLSDYRSDDPNPVPLLYQSGYLTIKDYDKRFRSYLLGYPNDEVKYGFLDSLIPLMMNASSEAKRTDSSLNVQRFVLDVEAGDTDAIRNRLTALFASLPYPEGDPDRFDKYVERDFQNVIYISFMLMGQYVRTQVHNAAGRADVIVETADYVWLFEFKRDRSADEALKQIEDKGYALPYAADPRKILKIGVNFDSNARNISEWIVV